MRDYLPNFLKWRYDLYLSEKIDLYGTLGFYLKQKLRRAKLIKTANVAYIYANKRNVGDYISYCGIRQIVGLDGPELFCSPEWAKSLTEYLHKIKAHNPNCLLVIGGGGLLQPVFKPFWNIVLNSGLRFVAVGVGVNQMQGRKLIEPEFINLLVKKSELFSVRDTATFEMIANTHPDKLKLGVCPSVNYTSARFWQQSHLGKQVLLHMKHPSDLRLSGIDEALLSDNLRQIANQLGWQYQEHTNMSSDHLAMLKTVSEAEFIVSSRLHGCIMAYSCGIPFLPILCDEKIAAFNQTHTGINGISAQDITQPDLLHQKIMNIYTNFDNQQNELESKVKQNIELGKMIKQLANMPSKK